MLLLNQEYSELLQRVLHLAVDRIYVSQFKIDAAGITGKGIVSIILGLLVQKRSEGVKVCVLLDCIKPLRRRSATNTAVAEWLMERGIEVRFLERNRCQHSKVVIVDGQHLLVGSHNWSTNSLLRNEEVSFHVCDLGKVSEIERGLLRRYLNARLFKKREVK